MHRTEPSRPYQPIRDVKTAALKRDVHGCKRLLADEVVQDESRGGIMTPVQKLLFFRKAIEGVIPLNQLGKAVRVESSNWFCQVPKCPAIIEIQRLRLVVSKDPRKDGVLCVKQRVDGGKSRLKHEKVRMHQHFSNTINVRHRAEHALPDQYH